MSNRRKKRRRGGGGEHEKAKEEQGEEEEEEKEDDWLDGNASQALDAVLAEPVGVGRSDWARWHCMLTSGTCAFLVYC